MFNSKPIPNINDFKITMVHKTYQTKSNHLSEKNLKKNCAPAGIRTRDTCLEGRYDNHYTTGALAKVPIACSTTNAIEKKIKLKYELNYEENFQIEKKGLTGVRTRVGGIKIHSDNHYTMKPMFSMPCFEILLQTRRYPAVVLPQ